MKMNEQPPKIETSILDSMENQIALARKLENVYSERPEIKDFVGSMKGTKFEADYTKEKIQADIDYIEEKRQLIEEQNSSKGRELLDRSEGGFALSEMMQAMIVDQINKGWLSDFKAEMTSDYDDLKVGIDAVMKHTSGGYLGAAFDFTVSSREEQLSSKLNNLWKRNIEKGSVPTVKYFKDPDTGEQSRLLVPKFIIGGSKKDVEDLASAYLSDDQETLKNHPLKYLIIDQITAQLDAILSFYETNADDNKLKFAFQQYKKIEGIIQNIKKDMEYEAFKKNNLDYFEYQKGSKALAEMKRFGASFHSEAA